MHDKQHGSGGRRKTVTRKLDPTRRSVCPTSHTSLLNFSSGFWTCFWTQECYSEQCNLICGYAGCKARTNRPTVHYVIVRNAEMNGPMSWFPMPPRCTC